MEIGANSTIDRGALAETKIGDGVKIDNLVQIAHNVHIGDNTVICGCTGVAGSAVIGKNCMIGGAVRILGHIVVGGQCYDYFQFQHNKKHSRRRIRFILYAGDANCSLAAFCRRSETINSTIKEKYDTGN